MKRITNIEPNSEEWEEYRRPNIGGSDSKSLKPLSRGSKKGLVEGSAGFWKFVAGLISQKKDGEDDRARGHRTEADNLKLTNQMLNLSMSQNGIWVSSYSDYIHISPDADDGLKTPLDAFEGKCFDSHKHLEIIYNDLLSKKKTNYNPLHSLPSDNQDQAVKYFSVCETLERLHWSLINENVEYPSLRHYVITIKRSDVSDLVSKQIDTEVEAVKRREEVIKFMLKELK